MDEFSRHRLFSKVEEPARGFVLASYEFLVALDEKRSWAPGPARILQAKPVDEFEDDLLPTRAIWDGVG